VPDQKTDRVHVSGEHHAGFVAASEADHVAEAVDCHFVDEFLQDVDHDVSYPLFAPGNTRRSRESFEKLLIHKVLL
jgi:hypothetical protein